MATNALNWLYKGGPGYAEQAQMDVNGNMGNPFDAMLQNPAQNYGDIWSSMGFGGQSQLWDSESGTGSASPELTAWLQQQGIRPAATSPQGGVWEQAYLDAQNNPINGTQFTMAPRDQGFWNAAIAAGLLAGSQFGGGAGDYGGADAAGLDASMGGGGVFPEAAATYSTGGLPAGAGVSGYGGSGLVGSELTGYGGMMGGAGGAAAPAAGGGSLMSSMGNMMTSPYGLGQLGSAAIGLYGNQQAIGAMQDATNQANGLAQQQLNYSKELNAPLVGLRNSVLPQINALLSNPSSITQDPGYQFGLKQGADQLNNRAAASGSYYSGGQMKAAQRYGQDYAGTKLDQSLNRLTTVAGLGQVGANNAQTGMTNGTNALANNSLQMGNARGSLYGGNAQLAGNALGNIFNNWQYGNVNGGP